MGAYAASRQWLLSDQPGCAELGDSGGLAQEGARSTGTSKSQEYWCTCVMPRVLHVGFLLR